MQALTNVILEVIYEHTVAYESAAERGITMMRTVKPTRVDTRRHETEYIQIRCNSCMYSQTFFSSAVRLWNRLPLRYLLPST